MAIWRASLECRYPKGGPKRPLALALLAAPLAAGAQQPTKVPRIGVLWPVSDDPVLEGFRKGLRDLGYVEGQDVVIEYRYARGKDDLLPDRKSVV